MLLTSQFPNGLRYRYVFFSLECLYMTLPLASNESNLYTPSLVFQNFIVSSLVELSLNVEQHFPKIYIQVKDILQKVLVQIFSKIIINLECVRYIFIVYHLRAFLALEFEMQPKFLFPIHFS